MAVVRQRDQMPTRTGAGWTEVCCAGPSLFGAPVPMSARELRIDPGITMPAIEITGDEAMGYVAAGSGIAEAGGERFNLEHESVLWLAGGGQLILTAGGGGLTVLLADSSGAEPAAL
jgi:hypothetical protein